MEMNGEVLTAELTQWLKNSKGLEDDHTTHFVNAPEWQAFFGPGPIRVLPGVIEWSLRVFEEALQIVSGLSNKYVDLLIELEWGQSKLEDIPRNPEALQRLLSVTPPSLLVYDADHSYGKRPGWPRVQCVELDWRELFGDNSINRQFGERAFFDECFYEEEYPRYIYCTQEDIVALAANAEVV